MVTRPNPCLPVPKRGMPRPTSPRMQHDCSPTASRAQRGSPTAGGPFSLGSDKDQDALAARRWISPMKCGGPASGATSERPLTARAGTPRNAGEQLERLTTKRHPPIAQPGHRPRRHSPTPEVGLRFQRQPRRRRPGPKTRAGLGLPPEANPVGYPASACRAKALKRPRSFRSVQDPVPGAGHPAPPGPYRVRLVRQRQWLQARH